MDRRSLVSSLITAELGWLYRNLAFKKFLQLARPRRAFVLRLELCCGCVAHFFYQFKSSQLRMVRYDDVNSRITVDYFVPVSTCPIDHRPEITIGYPEYRIKNIPFSHSEIYGEIERQKNERSVLQGVPA